MSLYKLAEIVKPFEDEHATLDSSFAFDAVKEITSAITELADYSLIDQYLRLVFHEECGILVFLKACVTKRPFEKFKLEVFKLIIWIVQQKSGWKNAARPYISTFKRTCYLFWSNGKETSKIQQISLECMISILESYENSLDKNDLELIQLYYDLLPSTEKSSYQPTVRGKMFHLIGLVVHVCAEDFSTKDPLVTKLFNHYASTINYQIESVDSKLEVSILEGCLYGLNCILTHHIDLIMESCSLEWMRFCENLSQVVDPSCSIENKNKIKIKRRQFQRAGLEIVANHSEQLLPHLCKNYKRWFGDLAAWSKSNNAGDNKVGLKAMLSFFESLTLVMCQENMDISQDSDKVYEFVNDAFRQEFCEFFLEKFRNILECKGSHKNETLVAAKGLGSLSDIFMKNENMDGAFVVFVNHIEDVITELHLPVTNKYSGSLHLLGTYIESIASILSKLGNNSDAFWKKRVEKCVHLAEELCVLLATFFPDLTDKYQEFCHISFNKLAQSLYLYHYHYFKMLLGDTFPRILVSIMAAPTAEELEIMVEVYNKTHSKEEIKKSARSQLGLKGIKSYTPFWSSIFNSTFSQGSKSFSMHKEIFDSVMQWSLDCMRKLDLTITFSDEEMDEPASVDPVFNAVAAKQRDFQIFINLVDFMDDILSSVHQIDLSSAWIDRLIYQFLEYIEEHPLVSGFYKLLSTVFRLASRHSFFDKVDAEKNELLKKGSSFLKNAANHIHEFRDDLLVSLLEVWLAAPHKMIVENYGALTETMKMTFLTGKHHYMLAEKGVEALEQWLLLDDFPQEITEHLFSALFLIWKSYFVAAGNESIILQENKTKKLTTEKQRRLRKVKQKFMEDASLTSVQHKLLDLIGSYSLVMEVNYSSDENVTLGAGEKILKYSLPLSDIKPDLHLDYLLPRVLDLCHTASDRQTRSSACEFLHTFALYFIGYCLKITKPGRSLELFRKLFKSMMVLGSDTDPVVCQLFNPLSVQTIHWMSRQNNPYGDIVLSVLMDNISQAENASLRDFSGVGLSEYFTWCGKHGSHVKCRDVLKYIMAMSSHAAERYRQGASLSFNSIYKAFRENVSLVNEFTFTLLCSFVTGLKLADSHDSETSESTLIKSTLKCITDLERIVSKKKDNFNNIIQGRRIPTDFPQGEIPTLRSMLFWLFQLCGSENAICQKEVVRLLKSFSSVTKDVGSLSHFLLYTTADKEPISGLFVSTAEQAFNKTDVLTALRRSEEAYLLFAEEGLDLSKLLSSDSSVFILRLREVIRMSPSSINKADALKLLGIIGHVSPFMASLSCEDKEKLACFGLELALRHSNSKVLLEFNQFWNICAALDPSCKEPVKQIILSALESFVSESLTENGLRVGNVLLSMATLGVLNPFIPESTADEFTNNIWTLIEKTLFCHSSEFAVNNMPMAQKITFKVAQGLNLMLRLVIALNDDNYNNRIHAAVFDDTLVSCGKEIITKGEYFQRILCESLIHCKPMRDMNHLKEKISMQKLGEFLERLLCVIKTDKDSRIKYGEEIVTKCLSIWSSLYLNCDAQRVTRIIFVLANVNFKTCQNSVELGNWWKNLMTSPISKLKDKAGLIHFIGLFLLSPKQEIQEFLRASLQSLTQSCQIPENKWPDEKSNVLKIASKLVLAYHKSPHNMMLLDAIIAIMAYIGEHEKNTAPVFTDCRRKLKKIVEKPITDHKQFEILACIFRGVLKCLKGEKGSPIIVCKSLLLPVLSSVTLVCRKRFYDEYLLDIVKMLEVRATTVYTWYSKTVGLYIAEGMPYLIGTDYMQSDELFMKYVQLMVKDGTTTKKVSPILKTLVKCAMEFRTVQLPTTVRDPQLKKAIYTYFRASYNALSALISSTKDEEKFYSGLLFMEKKKPSLEQSKSGAKPAFQPELLWEKLLLPDVVYDFPVILPDQLEAESPIDLEVDAKDFAEQPQRELFPTKTVLAHSSLAMEATDYDFTAGFTVEDTDFYKRIYNSTSSEAQKIRKALASFDFTELNSHECIFMFSAILKKVCSIVSTDELTSQQNEGPSKKHFHYCLLESLTDSETKKDVKIFLIGGILNCSEAIKKFAPTFVDPILNFLLEDHFTHKLNYFVKDVIVMLLSWREIARPTAVNVKRLLQFFIQHAEDESHVVAAEGENPVFRKDIYNHNLDLLESIVKYWVTDSDQEENSLPYESILDALKNSNGQKTFGLDVCKRILDAGALPCASIMLRKLMELVVGFLKASPSKAVCTVVAQVFGAMLKFLKSKNSTHLANCVNFCSKKIESRLSSMVHLKLHMLQVIQPFYPEFITPFRNFIISHIQTDTFKRVSLSLLPSLVKEGLKLQLSDQLCHQYSREIVIDLHGRHVFDTPCNDDFELEVAIELLQALSPYLELHQVSHLVNWASGAEQSLQANLRAQYASIVSQIYINSSEREPLKPWLKMFVRLYNDKSEEVQSVVKNFWANTLANWNSSPSLILELMDLIGDLEDNSVSILISLVIARCSTSPDFCKNVFEHPLEDTPFVAYQLDTSWRMKNTNFHRLFADSLPSHRSLGGSGPTFLHPSVGSQRHMNLINATLKQLQFTPTLPHSSQSDHPIYSLASGGFSQLAMLRNSIELENLSPEASTVSSQSNDPLARLRRKFYASPIDSTVFYARREIQRQEADAAATLEEAREKRGNVTLARTYRIGELPDIMMKHNDILHTISALTKRDDCIGRIFLVMLFNGIVKEQESNAREVLISFLEKAKVTFESVLRNYVDVMSIQMAGAILEICIHHKLRIDPFVVSTVARKCGLQKLSILLMEEYVGSGACTESDRGAPSKRLKTREDLCFETETDMWLRITEMYKDFEDYDVLRSIFDRLKEASDDGLKEIYEEAKLASAHESVAKLEESLKIYDKLFQGERDNGIRKQLWEDGINKCLMEMSDWKTLYGFGEKYYENQISSPTELMEDENFRTKVLPLMIQSGVQVLVNDLESEGDKSVSENFDSFIMEAWNHDEWQKELTEKYHYEMALWFIAENRCEMAQCGMLLESGRQDFLKQFRLFDILSVPQRRDLMLKLQKSLIASDTLNWYREYQKNSGKLELVTRRLVSKWNRSSGSKLTPLLNADMIVSMRNYFGTKIAMDLDSEVVVLNTKEEIIGNLAAMNFHQHVWALQLGIHHHNFVISEKFLKHGKTSGSVLSDDKFVSWRKCFGDYLAEFCSNVVFQDWVTMWCSAWNKCKKLEMLQTEEILEIQSDLLMSLVKGLCANAAEPVTFSHKLLKSLQCDSDVPLEATLSAAHEVIKNLESLKNKDISETLNGKDLFIKMYRLIDVVASQSTDLPDLDKCKLQSLLLAMRNGCSESVRLFPCALSILLRNPSLSDTFRDLTIDTPCWMFLPWLDQIVTYYYHKKSVASCLKDLISRLIKSYPEAFQLQYPELMKEFGHSSSAFHIMYAKALSTLVMPDVQFRDIIEEIQQGYHKIPIMESLGKLQNCLQQVCNNDAAIYGKIHITHASELLLKVIANREKVQSMNLVDDEENSDDLENVTLSLRRTMAQDLLQENAIISKEISKKLSVSDLQNYSPWLYKFHFASTQYRVEVPGLYGKFQKPCPESHPNVVSFHPVVDVMKSLMKPVSFSFLGNDGKRYKYLAKYGDDLRQDKRILQTFDLANQLFIFESSTRQRNLSVVTFSVLPFNKSFGILQWIDSSVQMSQFIFSTQDLVEKNLQYRNKYEKWVKSTAKHPSPAHRYLHSAEKTTVTEAIGFFDNLVRSSNPDLLRNGIIQKCNNYDEFFTIRERFTKSFASMSILHWIFGIGDRHLQNSLMSLETGQVIGIDFGRSFGTGISLQPVPELVPFRLTPQFENVLQPYGRNGLLKEIMIFALRSLIQRKDLILAISEVYLSEPAVTWRKVKKRRSQDMLPSPSEKSDEWIPMKIMKQKLSGESPVKIILEELKSNKLAGPAYSKVLLTGREELINECEFTEEETVCSLLNLATDKKILTTLFSGWCSWV